MDFDYSFDDIVRTYSALGVETGITVFVTGDLGRFGRYEIADKHAIAPDHYRALRELLGPEGTLIVPTASTNLCSSDIPYDPATTPSHNMGVLPEYVRTLPGSLRSFHPFWSLVANGPAAQEIVGNVSRHAYGWGSVWQRMVDKNILCLHLGKHPRLTTTLVHHAETVSGVPYRYSKEFIHPVMREGKVCHEAFYLSVLYRECDIVRDKNKKIFSHFENEHVLKNEKLGRSSAYSFYARDFVTSTCELMVKDIYCWLEVEPKNKPYLRQ